MGNETIGLGMGLFGSDDKPFQRYMQADPRMQQSSSYYESARIAIIVSVVSSAPRLGFWRTHRSNDIVVTFSVQFI